MRHAAVLLVAGLLVSACGGTGAVATPAPPTPLPTPRQTLTLPDEIDLESAGALRIEAAPDPDFAVVFGGFLYVGGVGQGIARFDDTGQQATTWAVPGATCGGLDAGFGAVWSATCDGPGLVRIDVDGDALTPIDVGGVLPESEASIGAGEGAVWLVVGEQPRTLLKVDPVTNLVVGRYPMAGSATAVRAGLGGVWVSDTVDLQVLRLDPADGSVVAEIGIGGRPRFLAVGEGAVWVMDQAAGRISRVDPAANAVTAVIELGEPIDGGDVAVGGGFVWVHGSRTLLFKIDPATNQVVARYGPSSGSGGVTADADAVWITAHDVKAIWRLPLR